MTDTAARLAPKASGASAGPDEVRPGAVALLAQCREAVRDFHRSALAAALEPWVAHRKRLRAARRMVAFRSPDAAAEFPPDAALPERLLEPSLAPEAAHLGLRVEPPLEQLGAQRVV